MLLSIKTDWKFIILAGDPNGFHTADTRLEETWVKLLAEGGGFPVIFNFCSN